MATKTSRKRKPSREQLEKAFRAARRYLRRPYVTGITIGEPIRSGELYERDSAICIHVGAKIERTHLRKDQIFPREILGVPVDVVERVHRPYQLSAAELRQRQISKDQPMHPGVAIGTESGSPGTLGLFVFDRTDGRQCILTAAHVLDAPTGTTVLQPSALAGGVAIGHVGRRMLDSDGDAAFARLNGSRHPVLQPLGLPFVPTRVQAAHHNQRLVKSGAKTGVTEGIVHSIGNISVPYPDQTITMRGFEIRPVDPTSSEEISEEGDSGGIWLDAATGDAVGLTVGGDGLGADLEFALACHLDLVFHRLQITMDPDDLLPA